MSKSHINSTVALSSAIGSVDEHTTFFLSPNNSEMISDNGIYPIANTTVFRKDEGKFKHGVAIEDDTINLMRTDVAPGAANDTGSNAAVTPYVYNGISGYRITKTVNSGWGSYFFWSITGGSLSDTVSKYSFSVYAVNLNPSLPISISATFMNGPSQNNALAGSSKAISNTLQRLCWDGLSVVANYNPAAGDTQWHVNFGSAADFFIASPQLEVSNFTTSFTNTSRENGILRYPKNIINPSEGTVAFWFNPLSNVGGAYPQMAGIGWWSNPADRDWIGIYHDDATWQNGITLGWSNKSGESWQTSVGSKTDIEAYKWHFVVFTWNFNTKQAYVYLYKSDGTKLKGGGTSTITAVPDFISETYFMIGRNQDGNIQNAMFSAFRIDDIARKENEIDQWHKSQFESYYYDDYSAMA